MRKKKQREEPLTAEEVLEKLQHYCAYQDRCLYEIQQKLEKLEADAITQEAVIILLEEHRFWDEDRFALNFVRSKWEIKKWGKIKIRKHLRQKRVPEKHWKAAFAQIEEAHYLETIQDLAENKWRLSLLVEDVFKRKKKVHDFLIGRGYEKPLVMAAISRLKEEEQEEEL